ncbi:PfkB family carbohydrate kinase [Humidesulfovibrio idahonensis]
MGATLVVALSPDADAAKFELPIPDSLRAKALQHMGGINLIVLGLDLDQAMERIRPDIYATMGEDDGEGGTEAEEAACLKYGVEFRRTSAPDFLSTLGINKFLSNFGDEVLEYLKLFKTRFTLAQVEAALDAMSQLKVAVIGDTIIDEYCYCNTLGVSSKDPILALRYRSKDTFAGGIVAVANHVANFAGKVSLFSVLGDHDSYSDFIQEKLNPGVSAHFATQSNAPTVRKRRYIEGYTQNKLFEIYFMEDAGLCEERDERFRQAVEEALPEHDLVIVADFGHGAVSPAMRRLLEAKAPFLAVNAQANSGNRGFHTVTKYARADYVSIAEHEMRLEMRDTRASVPAMIDSLAPRLSCKDFVVTRGKRGSTIRCADGRHITVPAFAKRIVDRIGAGDAFLSVTSLAACLAMEPELICFIGNIVGALAVEILGNQKSIDKTSVKRHAASLLG